jgi:pyruvate dehydrogenase E2 component (dihydrolipoamide acetyltransferase)
MSKEICMPKYGMSMLEGEIVQWLIKAGDKVAIGDDIVEITENKAVHVLQAMDSGILERIVVNEGEIAKVGEVIAVLSD